MQFAAEVARTLANRAYAVVSKRLPTRLKERVASRISHDWATATLSYAQHGEDLVLVEMVSDIPYGFYVDVGAFDPVRWSNTFALYQRGWSGLTVEPSPGRSNHFAARRPRDRHVECAVSSSERSVTLFRLGDQGWATALNSTSRTFIESRGFDGMVTEGTVVPARRLDELLDEYLPPGRTLDVLSIDVEGMDLDVLYSNDWSRYRPAVVIIEDADPSVLESPVTKYMAEQAYEIAAIVPLGRGVAMRNLVFRSTAN
jgi:FkbM family methyltransferase